MHISDVENAKVDTVKNTQETQEKQSCQDSSITLDSVASAKNLSARTAGY